MDAMLAQQLIGIDVGDAELISRNTKDLSLMHKRRQHLIVSLSMPARKVTTARLIGSLLSSRASLLTLQGSFVQKPCKILQKIDKGLFIDSRASLTTFHQQAAQHISLLCVIGSFFMPVPQ